MRSLARCRTSVNKARLLASTPPASPHTHTHTDTDSTSLPWPKSGHQRPSSLSDTILRLWNKTYSCYGSRQILTSLSDGVLCLMRIAHVARFLSDTTHRPMMTLKSVCRTTVPDTQWSRTRALALVSNSMFTWAKYRRIKLFLIHVCHSQRGGDLTRVRSDMRSLEGGSVRFDRFDRAR